MLKYHFIFLSLILLGTPVLSQSDERLDSLRWVMNNHPEKDTVYLEALLVYARQIRDISIDSAIENYEKVIELSVQLGQYKKQIQAANGIGICYGMQGNYPKSIEFFKQGLTIASKINDAEEIGNCYNGLGVVYKRLSDYPTSAEYYKKAMMAYIKINDEKGLAAAYSNIGVLHDLMKEPELSMESYKKALDIYKRMKSANGIASTNSNIAVLYMAKEQYDSAIILLKQVLKHNEENNNKPNIITASINLGHCYFNMKNYPEAQKYLYRALEMAESFDFKQDIVTILYNLARIDSETGKYKEALLKAERYKVIANELKSYRFFADVEKLFSIIYDKKGDYKQAYEHQKLYTAYQDSIFEENKVTAFKSQQVKMEVLEKDKELAKQAVRLEFLDEKIELESRWKWMLAITSFLFLIAGLLYYMKFHQKKKYSKLLEEKNHQIRHQKAAIEEINIQLENKMLRAQMNPHFIFNALSSIQHFITTNDKKSALKFLSKFSSLLRQVLESSINVNMLLKDEIELLNIYMELEALRFEDGFNYEITTDEQLDIYMLEMPTLLIQPFVENAILHGLLPKQGERNLKIHFSDNDHYIRCDVQDNGIGRTKAMELKSNKNGKTKSRGVSLSEQRLKLLADNYGLHTEVSYTDLFADDGTAAGTKVTVKIPKHETP